MWSIFKELNSTLSGPPISKCHSWINNKHYSKGNYHKTDKTRQTIQDFEKISQFPQRLGIFSGLAGSFIMSSNLRQVHK